MKKRIVAALIAILACLAVLAGCAGLSALERDVQVVLKVHGEYYGCYTVNMFNNAVVPVPDAPEGTSFLGWTGQENWEELELDEIVVSANKGLIRYDDVKDYVKGEAASVTLYAAFAVIPPKDLVVAWYRADGVSTDTGLNQEIMDSFTEDMYAFLETKDYHPAEMDIVVRPYDKNVGTSCAAILADGDVDLMVGWASNIKSQGGINFKENNDEVTIGTVSRYAARLTDTYLARLVNWWILTTYGSEKYANLPEPDPNDVPPVVEPEPEPEPSALPAYKVPAGETFSIKIAWYAKSETSGINAALMEDIVKALKDDLAKMGFNLANVNITTKGYDGNVGPSCAEILADGDVDLMLGWGANIGTTGGMTKGEDFLENVGGVKFGDVSGRYVTLNTDSDFVKIVFAWVQNTYGTAVDYPACFDWEPPTTEPEPEPEPEPTDKETIVIAWYRAADVSTNTGLTEENVEAFKTALTAYLLSRGYEANKLNIVLRPYDGNVSASCGAITAAGDVDIMIGWAANITSNGIAPIENVEGITVGTVSRYAARLTDTELVNLVFDWVEATYGPNAEPEDPVGGDHSTEIVTLSIGWWSYSTSGLSEAMVEGFKTALIEYLVSEGYTAANITITLIEYSDSKAAALGEAINADIAEGKGPDIVIGVGNNIDSASGANVSIIEKENNLTMGSATGRVIARITDSAICEFVYDWAVSADGLATLA